MALIHLTESQLKKVVKEAVNDVIVGWPMHYRNMYDDIGDGYLINEGLIKTYPLNFVQKYFKGRYLSDVKEKYFVEDEYRIILVLNKDSKSENEIEKVLDRFGYYLAYSEVDANGCKCLQFEPKFQNTFTGQQIIDNGINYLIHVSPTYNRERILRNGLCPVDRNDEFTYPGRVYFFVEGTPKHFIQSMVNRLSKANKSKGNNGRYSVFKVDMRGLEDMRFNLDFNSENAVFTTENIPPTNITEIGFLQATETIFNF